MAIFDDMTPIVERLGIDEAFLDVAGARGVIGSPAEVGALIRSRVRAETGLACSVGAASTKFVAKLASGRAKPDGLLVIPRAETLAFLHPLPVGALWGVGAVTEKALVSRGLTTIGDIARAPIAVLRRVAGEAGSIKLHNLANGIDPRMVTPETLEKSVGHEVTFEIDVSDSAVLRRELLRQSTQVARRLRGSGAVGRTVVLKLRYADFTTITRSRTLAESTDVGRRIADEVRGLYEAVGAHPPVRLIGVRMEQLTGAGDGPGGLWDDDEDWRGAERVIDSVGQRFGGDLVGPASLLKPASELGPSKRRPHV